MRVLTNLDLAKNQIQNALLHLLTGTPGTPSEGQFWYSSVNKLPYYWDGTQAVPFSGASNVTGVTATLPLLSSGGTTPNLSINPATGSLPGSFSALDFAKLAASTSANTNSTLVQRDASGNFLASVITASLQGNASTASALATARQFSATGKATAAAISFSGIADVALNITALSVVPADIALTSGSFLLGSAGIGAAVAKNAIPLSGFGAATADVAHGGFKITGLADPTAAQDAATKNYVDNLSAGLSAKGSVRAATVGNVALTGTQTVDGSALVAGDRVLVKNQTTATQNGLYLVAAGAWTRTTDADTNAEVSNGLFVFVEEGATQADSGWVLTTDGAITLGVTNLTFVQFSGAGQIIAGSGLSKTGNTLAAVGTTNRIVVGAGIDIDAAYAGQASITTLGTITTGTWNGTAIPLASGGTGANTATAARANLGAVGRFAASIGDGSATSYTVTHNLGTRDVQVQIYESAAPYNQVLPDIQNTSTTTATILFATPPTVGQYRVVVVG